MERFRMSPVSPRNTDHVVVLAGSIALAIITQLCSDIFCVLAIDSTVPNALFQNSVRNVSETFPLEVTMDWWSENNWIMTDIWSKAWLLEAVVSLCKRNVHSPASYNPEVHPPAFYLIWATVNSARICSMFLWDRQEFLGAVVLTWILPALSFYMLYMSYSNLDKCKAWLAINNPNKIQWIRYLTQNGLALFAWWTLLNAVVRLGVLLKYTAGVQDPQVSSLVLTFILLCTLIWFILQSILLRKYMRHTSTVYAILILGVGAMFTRSYSFHSLSANTVYCGFFMLLMTIMSVMHLVSACLLPSKTSTPPAVKPHVTFENCVTVCRPEIKSLQHLQN